MDTQQVMLNGHSHELAIHSLDYIQNVRLFQNKIVFSVCLRAGLFPYQLKDQLANKVLD